MQAPLDDKPAGASRSARFGVHVTLPAGQGITALPLPQLYAALGTLGRVEDLQLIEGTDGAASLSLALLTTEVEAVVHGKLAAVLGGATVRVEAGMQTPRLAETMPEVVMGLSLLIIAIPLIRERGWLQWRRLSRSDVVLAMTNGPRCENRMRGAANEIPRIESASTPYAPVRGASRSDITYTAATALRMRSMGSSSSTIS